MPGAPLSVRIRGVNSITGSNEPLYVIDGYIGGSIETVSPSDIESLEILKDASASAIYGSRGSNGVVLITTKTGHEGTPKVNVDAWFQKAEVAKELDLMNAYDFANTVNIPDSIIHPRASAFTPRISLTDSKPIRERTGRRPCSRNRLSRIMKLPYRADPHI